LLDVHDKHCLAISLVYVQTQARRCILVNDDLKAPVFDNIDCVVALCRRWSRRRRGGP